MLEYAEKRMITIDRKLKISEKWMRRHSSMDESKITTFEYEEDKNLNEYLNILQEKQNLQNEIIALNKQIAENKNNLAQLDIEQFNEEQNLKTTLYSAYQELYDNIKMWEQRYVFKSPINGKIDFLRFISEGMFIQAGEEVFGIIPEENKIFGQLTLPSSGAGKVKTGCRAVIKLANYPYREFGSIEGTVSSISSLTQSQHTANASIDTYLITIELPEGLKTNYGETLPFQHELGGTCDIIIKDRRLIERLFDNLKYRTN